MRLHTVGSPPEEVFLPAAHAPAAARWGGRTEPRRLALLGVLAMLLVAPGCRAGGGADGAPEPPGGRRGELFVDVTAGSGIEFRHINGATGQKYILETIGSGVCVFDYDGDRQQDLYFVQSGRLPGFTPTGPVRPALYRNLGGGRFADVTEATGLAGLDRYCFGCSAADVDGDGDRDLYVTCYGPNVLYRNNGDGTFGDVTDRAGVGDPGWGTSAGFADDDGDGDLDLYVANYLDFDLDNNIYCGENRPGYRKVCHPRNFNSQPDVLYRNNGDGTFKDVTLAAGIVDRTGKGLGVVWGDYDQDGDQDVYAANDDTPNFLWRNGGHGSFEEVGDFAGVALSEDGIPEAGMGTDMADYDNDGLLDLFVTNLAEETNELYHNDGGGFFSNRTFTSGLGPPSLLDLGFGTFFFDMDNDGDLDLFVANGHVIDNIELYSDTITHAQRAKLYVNLGAGRFDPVAFPAASPLGRAYVGRGAVPFDFDDDGDEDVVMSQNDRPAVLLRNDSPPRHHWLTLTLQGTPPNGDAIGAFVTLFAGGTRQVRYVRTACSYLSQPDRRIHFGLGPAASIDRVVVRWPDRAGFEEEFRELPVDRFVVLERDKGRPTGARLRGTTGSGR